MTNLQRMTRWRTGLAVVVLITTLFSMPALADEASARHAYDEAQQMMGREDFRAAAEAFHGVRAGHPDSPLAASAAYWEAFALYRMGGTARLKDARDLLIEAEALYGSEPSADHQDLLARIEGSLARRGDARAAEEIQRLSEEDEDEAIRIAAINALVNMDSKRALPILARLVSDHETSPELREQAVFLISQQDGPEVSELLLYVARKDPSQAVRGQAIFWLGQTGGDEAVIALEEILKTETDPEILGNAMFALSQSGSAQAFELLSEIAANKTFDDETRGNAIFWLGQDGGPEAMRFLQDLYPQIEDPEIKGNLLFAVSQSGGSETSQWLLGIATDPTESMEIRKTALFWAGQTGDVGVSQLMEIYGTTDDFEMKEQIIFVLSQDDSSEAVDALLELAKTESDMDLRTKAIFWLGQSDDDRVVEYLGELIER